MTPQPWSWKLWLGGIGLLLLLAGLPLVLVLITEGIEQ